MSKGKFIVVDGLDGVGKGVVLKALVEEAQTHDKQVFDVEPFQRENNYHPPLYDLLQSTYDAIVTAEPTFVGIGRHIREEITAVNGRNYSPQIEAEAYALDRRILYEQLVLPALDRGINVFQSRSFSTSIVYQRQRALDEGKNFSVHEILSIPNNNFCYQHPMDLLIVPTIQDVEEALRRAQQRDKDDQSRFENLEFQLKIKPHYESDEFKNVFRQKGVPVVYLDAGKTIKYTQEQARTIYQRFLRSQI